MELIQAKWYTKGPRRGPIDLVVLHAMQSQEKGDTAENVARYFANGAGGRKASAHVNVDSNTAVRCVKDSDIAYAAPGANHNGLHIEHAGWSAQTVTEWRDTYGEAMLAISAVVARGWCEAYGIPVRFVDAAGLKRGERGITTHFEVSEAFKRSTHTDPGKGFPIGYYLDLVRGASAPVEEDWMASPKDWDEKDKVAVIDVISRAMTKAFTVPGTKSASGTAEKLIEAVQSGGAK